ncbi:MAG: PfkB family carbohydrate kinase [Bryobacterales bacterium]|nr:PfkB family carbohydrate kinase [Bryobacterales bacterium]
MSVLVVGSVAYDGIETPRGKVDRVLGGAGSYIALAASHFANVRLVAIVGDDFAPEDEAVLRRRSIDLEGLERAPGKTFFWQGVYSRNMNERRTLATDLNVFADFRPRLPESYRDTPLILLGNIQPSLQDLVVDQAANRRFVAGDTMNYWIERTPDELARAIQRWDAILINDEEARQLSGEDGLRSAAKAIQAMGPASVVIKRGEYGAALFQGDSCFLAPAYPLGEVIDPTGAGDAFAGGFMGWLDRCTADGPADPGTWERELRRAVVYGSIMGSFCCERFGVEGLRELTMERIEARFHEFERLTAY